MSLDDEVRAVRSAAGIFLLVGRGVIEVRGADRVRFLNGQLSNDVAALDPAGPHSGCYALLLTPQGRIVTDLHVLARPDAVWLETALERVPAALARLGRYVIADDVGLADRSAEFARLAVEGPRAPQVVAAFAGAPLALAPDAWLPLPRAGAEGAVAAWGESGEEGFQLFAPRAAAVELAEALRAAGRPHGAALASDAALEVLRIEAGIPCAGAELGEAVLPAEVRLEGRAVSFTKGCYTGQEVVARMQSRGRVGHLLVGLRFEGALPPAGAELLAAGQRVGEVTSAACSPHAGPIGLGFVRRGHDEPGTLLHCQEQPARVAPLPFVPLPGRDRA